MENINFNAIIEAAKKSGSEYSFKIIESFAKIESREPMTLDNCDFKDIPWEDEDFSRRILMLATRPDETTIIEADFIEEICELIPPMNILDIASGTGRLTIEFAERGYITLGIDKGIAAVEYSTRRASELGLRSTEFIHANAADFDIPGQFDLAMFIYGAIANFTRDETSRLFNNLSKSILPGGYFIIELCTISDNAIQDSQKWYFSDDGLWGDSVYLVLMENFYNPEEDFMAIRHWIVDLADGSLRMVTGREHYYNEESLDELLTATGFEIENIYGGWDYREYSGLEESMIVVSRRS